MQSFKAPLCKGSSAAGGEGLFFYTPTAARFPNPSRRRLQACFAHSQIPPTAARFPNPSRRGLQACFAHSQIPCVKGAPPQAVRDCFFTTLQPLRGFRTRLGDACKHASHTCKSLTQGRLIQPSPVGESGSRRLTDKVYFAKETSIIVLYRLYN